jgi:integrase
MLGFKKFARQIVADAELPSDVTPRVLRHSFISLAGDLGLSLPITGALVGHKGGGVTADYTHLAATILLTAADAVANETVLRMGDSIRSAEIVEFQVSGRAPSAESGD